MGESRAKRDTEIDRAGEIRRSSARRSQATIMKRARVCGTQRRSVDMPKISRREESEPVT